MNRLDVGDGEYSVGALIMENDKLLSPASMKQRIRPDQPKSGTLQKKNAEIAYSLSKRSDVTVSIYTTGGMLAASYQELSISPSQSHTFYWDGTVTKGNKLKLKAGASVPKGSYYANISSKDVMAKTKNFQIK